MATGQKGVVSPSLKTAYKTCVRPQVEYCSIVWHPWQKFLIYKIEQVQRSAARYIFDNYDYTSSVSNELNWQTTEREIEGQ
jgi:hypothetical protein